MITSLNNIIKEIQTRFNQDKDLNKFCMSNYDKELTVKTGMVKALDIPIKDIPIIIISDGVDEPTEKRRFLYTEIETNLTITCGIIQNDIVKAQEELITFKELIKKAIKRDPLLNGKAHYSVVVRSKNINTLLRPLYFKELTLYVNY